MLRFFWWVVRKLDDCQFGLFSSLCTELSFRYALLAISDFITFYIFHEQILFLRWSVDTLRADESIFITKWAMHWVLISQSTRIFVIFDERGLILQHDKALRLFDFSLIKLRLDSYGWCETGNRQLLFVLFFNLVLSFNPAMIVLASKNSVVLLVRGLKAVILTEHIWVKIHSNLDWLLIMGKRWLFRIIEIFFHTFRAALLITVSVRFAS